MAGADDVKRYLWMMSILFGVACIVYMIVVYFFIGIGNTEVMADRFRNANDLFNGDPLDLEYPPFALVFMIIPRLFASTEFWYNVAYVAEVFVFFVIGLVFVSKLAKRFNYSEKKAMLIYTILMLLMFEFIVDRYDIFPAVITLVSFYCLVTKRYAWAFLLLSIGMMTKLYPAVLFPIYVIPFIMERNWRELIKGTFVFALTAVAIVIPVMIYDPEMISYFIGYHSDRPLQIESIVASLIYPFAMAGFTDVFIRYEFGSDNLMGAWPDAVAPFLTPLMIISILAVYVVYAYLYNRNLKNGNDEGTGMFHMGIAILMAIMLFMVVGKVFSSQYIIWIIPPLVFLFMVEHDTGFKKNLLLMALAGIVLTQINFAYNIGYLGGGANINDLGMMIILARNVVMVLMTYYIIRHVYRHFTRPRDETGSTILIYWYPFFRSVTMSGSCTIIIPTFNEEKNIVNMAKCLRELYPDFYISFMDDNSTDGSKRLIEELNDPKTRLVTRDPEQRGLAASVFQGILEAETDYFMTIDCDFQHPPGALADMYDKMESGCDLCIGVREDRFALGMVRWAGSWAFNVFADLYLLSKGKNISQDVMSGLIAGRTDVFVPVIKENWSELEMKGWKVLLDLLKFGPSDMNICNSRYRFGKRAEGESHLNPRVAVTTFNQCGSVGKFCARFYEKMRGV